MRFRLILPVLAACLLLGAHAARAQTRTLDDVVLANVNGQDITRRQLVSRLLEYRGEETLEKMINRVLLTGEAAKLKLSVPEGEVAQRLSDLQNRFKDENDYRGFLARSGLTEKQLQEEFRNTLLIQKVALKQSPIQDDELQEYDASMILAADKSTAEGWIKELDNGASFRDLASQRSVEPSLRKVFGRLKPFLAIEMLDVAKGIEDQKLQPGRYTKVPVPIADHWGIIRLEQRIPVSTASASHRERLIAAVTAYKVDKWLTEVRVRLKDQVQKKPLDQPVVAVVGGEPITRAQLVSRLLEYHGEETLQLMTNRALLLQAAAAQKVEISPEEAARKFAETRKGFKDDDAYHAFLMRSNLTEAQFKDELRYEALMEKVALKESPVVDEDLQQYQVRVIVAPGKKEAEAWIKDLDGGMDFGQMAAERSLDPNGRQAEGRMKPFLKVEMLDLWRALQEEKLKPGQYSKHPVLLTDNSWVILKLEEVAPPPTTPEKRAPLAAAVTQYRVGVWLNATRAKAKISFPTTLAQVIAEKPAN